MQRIEYRVKILGNQMECDAMGEPLSTISKKEVYDSVMTFVAEEIDDLSNPSIITAVLHQIILELNKDEVTDDEQID